MMPILIGLGLGLAVPAFARITGMDRDRAFYPIVLIVVAHYYFLFALLAGGDGFVAELALFAIFAATAVLGFRISLWFVVAGLAIHGLFDFTRHLMIAAHGAPDYWPAFCGTFDLVAPAVLAVILLFDKRGSETGTGMST